MGALPTGYGHAALISMEKEMQLNVKRTATGARWTLALSLTAALATSVVIAGGGPQFEPQDPDAPVTLTVGTLHLAVGDIRTDQLPDARTARGGLRAEQPHLIQLDGPMTPQRRQALENAGIKLGNYLPAYAYVADMRNVQAQALANLNFVVWVGEFQDAWKIEPTLGQRNFSTAERINLAQRGDVAVAVTIFSSHTANEALRVLRELGADVHATYEMAGNPIISATLALEDVEELATLPSVQYIEEQPEITPRNDSARWVVQSNQLNVTPLYDAGLRGEGQIVGVLDTALDRNHCMFVDSVPIGPNHRKIVAYHPSPGASHHGTHVSGTAAGDDLSGGANRRGVAYKGRIAYNTWPSFTEAGILQRFNLAHSDGARIHTNSWGDDGTTAYNGLTRGIDVFQWDNEESQTFWAVTNTSTMKNPENAKNTLAVGATEKAPNQHQHCTGGTGPTNDGRRKPEIYAPGCQTTSATPSSCGVSNSSGTSMASPAVAGVGMLARQYYMEGFYPTGIAGDGESFTPSGALVKATLLNSAVDMTGVAGYPSNQEGWGRVLADNTLYFNGDSRRLFVEDVWNADGLSTGQSYEEQIEVIGSGEKLKVTLVWTDFPGAAGTSFAAVNDLDLQVIGPDGTFLGNVFQGGVSVTGGTKDDRNNVEQVHISNPTPGTWTVRVVGAEVNQATQGFALVVTGDIIVQEPALIVTLPDGAPTLVDPGVPTEFNVRVSPGEENIVPESEELFYRMSDGSFTSVALQHIGGEIYTATLPAASCDDSPEFYVRAEGDGGTVRTSPANAPDNVYSAAVGDIATAEELYVNFNDGLPSGWTMTGLWNVTGSCAASGVCDGPQWAYYGQTSNCTYETGSSANSGSMTSAPIAIPTIPPGGSVEVSFCYNLLTEAATAYDVATFSVVGGPSVELSDSSNWTEFTMDLTQFAGETIQLRWHFDTIDGLFNNYRGWQVDAISITATGLECEDPEPACPEDLNGNGEVDVSDLLILLSDWGSCAGCPADLNGDGVVDVSDLLILLGAWGSCS